MSKRTRLRAENASEGMVWPLGSGSRSLAGRHAPPTVVGVADLRGANAAAILAAIRTAAEPPKLASLVEVTRLSRPTVEAIVEDLLQGGLVQDAPVASSRGIESPGRPARRFSFCPDAGYVVGVDVRAAAVNVCVADLNGTMVNVERRKVRRDLSGATRLKMILDLIAATLQVAQIKPAQVYAATVGTPGWVEDNARVRYVDNLKDWATVDITGAVHALLGCPVAVDNDANLAAVGEQWNGVATSAEDFIFVLIGERVGAGIIAGGQPLHGNHGAAGEIGFMVLSGGGPVRALDVGKPGGQRPGIDPNSFYSDADVVRRAEEGDPAAVRALEAVGVRLAEALAPVLLALDPEVVVIGASLFGVPDLLEASRHVLEAADRHAASLLVDPPRWLLSSLGDDAILNGATRFGLAAVEHVLLSRPLDLSH